MAKAATPSLAVPGQTTLPSGTPFVVYQKGVDVYEKLRLNGAVELVLDDSTKVQATVSQLTVGPLIDLLVGTGPQAIQTYGRIYSPLSVIQSLTEASTEAVLDVTKLYTAVSVHVPVTPLVMPQV